jgi:hypothetical protein
VDRLPFSFSTLNAGGRSMCAVKEHDFQLQA